MKRMAELPTTHDFEDEDAKYDKKGSKFILMMLNHFFKRKRVF
jgi:hypothetical protein